MVSDINTRPIMHIKEVIGPAIINHLALHDNKEKPVMRTDIIDELERAEDSIINLTKACEAHDMLLEALKDCLALLVNGPDGCDDDPARIIQAARDAIEVASPIDTPIPAACSSGDGDES